MLETIDLIATKIHNHTINNILCIGDVMLDQFYYGNVSRISPEAPVPVLNITEEKLMLGGAGNVTRNIVDFGAEVYFASVLGEDHESGIITSMLGEMRSCFPYIIKEHNRSTTVKTRCIGLNQQIVRLDKETSTYICQESQNSLFNYFIETCKEGSVVILSDYGKGLLETNLLQKIIKTSNAIHAKVIIDPKGTDYSKYEGCFLLTPNKKELYDATRMPVDSDENIILAATTLINNCGIKNILVTRSEEGMTLVQNDGSIHHIKATAKEVYDVSGAGDTVVATLSVSIAAGCSLLDSAILANQAASIVVGKKGTASVDFKELQENTLANESSSAETKIFSLQETLYFVDKWNKLGLTIGFTNGCFDLLHPGHIKLLESCRAQCDKLIVALNTDDSVKRLKGDTRPVQTELARAIVMASLQCVDMVTFFSDDTPLSLIKEILPHKLFKGGDYNVDTVVGADIVMSNGGEVVIIDLVEGQSTTRLVKRMSQPSI